MPCYDAGNNSSSSRNGGRDAAALKVSEEVPAQWWMDQDTSRRSGEREDAPDDHGGACEAQLAREVADFHRAGVFFKF